MTVRKSTRPFTAKRQRDSYDGPSNTEAFNAFRDVIMDKHAPKEVGAGQWALAPSLFDFLDLSVTEYVTLLALQQKMVYDYPGQGFVVGRKTLARAAHLCERSVGRAIKSLSDRGFVYVVTDSSKGNATTYYIQWHRILQEAEANRVEHFAAESQVERTWTPADPVILPPVDEDSYGPESVPLDDGGIEDDEAHDYQSHFVAMTNAAKARWNKPVVGGWRAA